MKDREPAANPTDDGTPKEWFKGVYDMRQGGGKPIEHLADKAWTCVPHNWIRNEFEHLAKLFWDRKDGAVMGTSTPKWSIQMYFVMLSMGLTPGRPYVWGSDTAGFIVPPMHMTEEIERCQRYLDQLARSALYKCGIRVPDTHAAWTVVCKYDEGHGVGEHKDTDYDDGGFPWIVTVTARGTAKMKIRPDKKYRPVCLNLSPSCIVVLRNDMWHEVIDSDYTGRLSISFDSRSRIAQKSSKPQNGLRSVGASSMRSNQRIECSERP